MFAIKAIRFLWSLPLALSSMLLSLDSRAEVLEIIVSPHVLIGEKKTEGCDWVAASSCEVLFDQLASVLSSQVWRGPSGAKVEQVLVRFMPGIHFFEKPLQLNWGSGGTADIGLVIYGAGASTVLSGARPVLGWKSLGADIRVADISDFALPLDKPMLARGFGLPIRPVLAALYQNDRELPLARWPNEGYAKIERPEDLRPDEKRTFRVAERTGLDWRNEVDLMVHGYWFHDWAAQAYPVTVGREGRLVIDGDGSPYGIRGGQRLLIENALSELDSSGEWYLNRSTGELFAWLPQENLPVEMAVAESVLRIEKSRNIIIRDLAIEKVRGDAVRVQESENIVFDNVSIRHTGNRALVVEGGRRNGVRNSLIEHNGEGGVSLAGGDRAKLVPAEHFVENVTIRDFSRLSKTYRVAVALNGVGQRVEGNKISDAPHAAIIFSGNDHKILNNEIFNVVLETSDAGAIYVGRDYTARGTVIEGNYLHDIRALVAGREVKGVYLDDQASGITIRCNVFAHVQQPVFIGGGRANVVEDNIFYESSPGVHLDARGLNWQRAATMDANGTLQRRLDAVPFQSELWRQRYPDLENIRVDELGAPKYNNASGNIVVKGKPHSVAKEALAGILLGDFVVADERIFRNPLPPNGRRTRADFVLRSVVSERCATQSGDWK